MEVTPPQQIAVKSAADAGGCRRELAGDLTYAYALHNIITFHSCLP